jgi:hypothetical protein
MGSMASSSPSVSSLLELLPRDIFESVVCRFLTDAERARTCQVSRRDAQLLRPMLERPWMMSRLLEAVIVSDTQLSPLLPVRHVIWDMSSRLSLAHARLLFAQTHPRMPASWFAGVRTLDVLSTVKGEYTLDDLLPHVFPRVTHLRIWDLRALPPTSAHARQTIRRVDYRCGDSEAHYIWQKALPNAHLVRAQLLVLPKRTTKYMAIDTLYSAIPSTWKPDRVYERDVIVIMYDQHYVSLVPSLGADPRYKTCFWALIVVALEPCSMPVVRIIQASVSGAEGTSILISVHGTLEEEAKEMEPVLAPTIVMSGRSEVNGPYGLRGDIGPRGLSGVAGYQDIPCQALQQQDPYPEHLPSLPLALYFPTVDHTILSHCKSRPSTFSQV